MRLFLAVALAFALSAPAAAMTLRQYTDIALSADGRSGRRRRKRSGAKRAAAGPPNASSSAMPRTGAVLATVDQCAGCRYFDPTFVPDGRLLAIVKDGSKTRLILVGLNGQAATLSEFEGIAQKPSLSPDGRSVAVLATFVSAQGSGRHAGRRPPGRRDRRGQ